MPTSVYKADSWIPTPLQLHHRQCAFSVGIVHRLRCTSEAIGSFIGARVVSALCLVSVLSGLMVSMHFGLR